MKNLLYLSAAVGVVFSCSGFDRPVHLLCVLFALTAGADVKRSGKGVSGAPGVQTLLRVPLPFSVRLKGSLDPVHGSARRNLDHLRRRGKTPQSERQLSVNFGFACVLLFTVPFADAAHAESCQCHSAASSGSITSLAGRATLAGPQEARAAFVGAQVAAGSLLVLEPQSSATVAFDPACAVTLGADDILTVSKLDGRLCPIVTASGGITDSVGVLTTGIPALGLAGAPLAAAASGAAVAVGVAEAGRDKVISP